MVKQPIPEVLHGATKKPCIKCGGLNRNKGGDCKFCQKIRTHIWAITHPEKTKISFAKWRAANSEKMKIYQDKYRAKNSEKVKAATRAWQILNPERIKANVTKWNIANPEACRIRQHNRRARERVNGGRLSKDLSKKLYKRQKGKCVCCRKLLGNNFHLDHIMPIKLGGKNEDWNIQLLGEECNLKKNAKHPITYMQERGFLL